MKNPNKTLRDDAAVNFKKAQSHLQKIINMLDEGQYCIDVMQQNLAVIGLLKSAHQMLMENHLKSCFIGAMQTNNLAKKNEMIEEILKVTKMYNK
ncbi:MAG: metal-sensing transcriptional repressor [Candidatus Buchananbacteria bacterium]